MPSPRSSPSAQRELVIERIVHAPRRRVFEAWTDIRQAMNWWGPKDHPAVHIEMDVRPGGAWRACLRSTETGQELWQSGVLREIAVPERIVFTFAWEEEGESGLETLVTVTFDEHGEDETRLAIRQTPFQSDEERDGHRGGWNSTFDRLDAYLAGVSDGTR